MIESTKSLKEAQAKEDSPEAKASLPTLAVKDLEREIKSIPIAIDSVQGVDVITHDIPSSGERAKVPPSPPHAASVGRAPCPSLRASSRRLFGSIYQ